MRIENSTAIHLRPWFIHHRIPRLALVWEGGELLEESGIELFYTTLLAFDFANAEGIRPKEVFIYTSKPTSNDLHKRFLERRLPVSFRPFLDFKSDEFQPFKLEVDLQINWCFEKSGQSTDLLISIEGKYPIGSHGDMEGKVIYYTLCMLAEQYLPARILIEVTKLDYSWGDELHFRPPQFIYVDSRIGLILSQEQKDSFSYAMREDRMFFSWEEALEKV